MKNLIAIAIIALFVQGCTPYQKTGLTGGYSETQLDENVFKVAFRGNAYTNRERVADFTLLRSAELTLENGFNYFVIIDANSYSKHGTVTTPSRYYTTGSAHRVGNYVYGSATTTQTGGQTFHYTKPSASNTIVCFKKKPDTTFSYNASFVYKSIREKYEIK